MRNKEHALCPWCAKMTIYVGIYNTGDYQRYAYKCDRCKAIIEVLK